MSAGIPEDKETCLTHPLQGENPAELLLAARFLITALAGESVALISAGNERQRKAIDNLCEQALLWAVQDLRIKCEALARDVHVDNPLDWLNKVTSRACACDLNLQLMVKSSSHCNLPLTSAQYGRHTVIA